MIVQRPLLRLFSTWSGQSDLDDKSISVSSAHIFVSQDSVEVGRLLNKIKKKKNNKGPNIYPCGTLMLTARGSERWPSTDTH